MGLQDLRSFRDVLFTTDCFVGVSRWRDFAPFGSVSSKANIPPRAPEAGTVRDAHRDLRAGKPSDPSAPVVLAKNLDRIGDCEIRELSRRAPRPLARGVHCQARRRRRGSRRNGTLADRDPRRAHHLDGGGTEGTGLAAGRSPATQSHPRRVGQDRARQSPQSSIDPQIRSSDQILRSDPQILRSSDPQIHAGPRSCLPSHRRPATMRPARCREHSVPAARTPSSSDRPTRAFIAARMRSLSSTIT